MLQSAGAVNWPWPRPLRLSLRGQHGGEDLAGEFGNAGRLLVGHDDDAGGEIGNPAIQGVESRVVAGVVAHGQAGDAAGEPALAVAVGAYRARAFRQVADGGWPGKHSLPTLSSQTGPAL